MKKIPVWFDCDTGVDDAIALILLSQLDSFDVVGVSTVAGNVGVDKTTNNTLRVLDLCRVSYPVYRGAAQPMMRMGSLENSRATTTFWMLPPESMPTS
jgi:inosine-uridine nucleoside N-ribohydrolase